MAMKTWIGILLLSCLHMGWAKPVAQVFVSFSMPEQLLRQTLEDSVRLKIPAILNGLHHDSMQETMSKILQLARLVPELNLQIDPTAFERFGIHQVPALVVSDGDSFDVIYGNLPLEEALSRIQDKVHHG